MVSPRVRLITGTSSGFGHRLVNLVLARGDRVIVTARTLANITHFLEDPKIDKSNIYCGELDISTGTQHVKERIDAIVQASGWGSVDVLVNNAGAGTPAFLEEGGYRGMDLLCMIDHPPASNTNVSERSGTVVMIGSRSGWKPEIQGIAFYASSKAAVHAFSETMAIELEPFGIRVLIVEPGSFCTEGIYRRRFDDSNPIPDYDAKRGSAGEAYRAPAGNQQGDPVKAMKALIDVVCGEGRAEGKEWPLYLVLGKDAERDVRNKCARMIRHLDEWSDIVRDVDFDSLNKL